MKKLLSASLIGLITIFTAYAQPSSIDPDQVIAADTAVRTGYLSNGARYYVRANAKDPKQADFHILYKVGAVQEEDRQNGLAHFLEHMAFNGSKHFKGNSLIDYLQSIGVEYGRDLNAFTSNEQTSYKITNVPIARAGVVDSVLLALHDWAGFISLTDNDIDKERGVIQEELRMYEAQSDFRVSHKIDPLIFGAENIYARRTILGTMDLLKTFTYQDIRDFYAKWYRPDMQAFIIVGDFDPDQMVEKLKKAMSDISPAQVQTPREVVPFEGNAEPRVAVVTDPEIKNTTVKLIFRHPSTYHAKQNDRMIDVQRILVKLMACNMLSLRLDDIAKGQNAPFQQAGVYNAMYYKPLDMFTLVATSRPGQVEKALGAAYTELLRAKRWGFVATELERTKANISAWCAQQYANRNDRRNAAFTNSYADNFNFNTAFPSAQDDYTISKAVVESITLDQINACIDSLVSDQNRVLTLTAKDEKDIKLPTPAELLAIVAQISASEIEPYTEKVETRPLIDPSKLKGSKVVKTETGKFGSIMWTLKNGIKVVVLPTTHQTDQILLKSFKKGGFSTIEAVEDLRSIKLYSSFEGIGGVSKFTDKELTHLLTGKQASLSPVFNGTFTGFDGQSTKQDFETMLQLLYLYAVEPRFEQADWNVMIDKQITSIKGAEKDPMRIMNDSIGSTIFAGDPREAKLTTRTIQTTSLERMKRVYKSSYASFNGSIFIIVGSVDCDSIKQYVERYIGSLPVVKSTPKPALGPYIPAVAKGVTDNSFTTPQESGQVIAFSVYSGEVEYSMSENLNLEVAGTTLNDVYTKKIREAKGGAYVVNNAMAVQRLTPKKHFLNQVIFITDTSKIAHLQPEVQLGIDSLMLVGPSPENVGKAKEIMTKQFTERNISNSTWLGYLHIWYLTGIDGYTTYLEELRKVDVTSVQEAAKRAFGQGNRAVVIQKP